MVLIGYDFRGRWGNELTPAFMRKLGKKLAVAGSIILGRDARVHSNQAMSSLQEGLLAGGCIIRDVGIIATPVVCWLAQANDCKGGMITASHNPPEWNGLKLFKEEGCGLLPQEYEEIMESDSLDSSSGSLTSLDPISYFEALEDKFSSDFSDLSVVVDTGGGVGSCVMPKVLEIFGCDFLMINSKLDGKFRCRSPEPKRAELRKLQLEVLRKNADCGLALDGDADRLVVIDNCGKLVDGNQLLALFAREEKEAVVPYTASKAVDEVCSTSKCRVGDVFVSQKLLETGISFGGEPSGHFSFKEWLPYPDPAYASGKLLNLLNRNQLSELLEEIPCYPAESESFPCSERDAKIKKLEKKFDSQSIGDGIKISFPDGWAAVRKSNTQPLLRLKYEAKSYQALAKIKDAIKSSSYAKCKQ